MHIGWMPPGVTFGALVQPLSGRVFVCSLGMLKNITTRQAAFAKPRNLRTNC